MKHVFQKIISFSFLVIFISMATFSYSQKRAIVEINVENFNTEDIYSQVEEIPLGETDQFLAVSAVLMAERWDSYMQIRFSKDNQIWSDWQILKEDSHSKKEDGRYISNLIFTEEGVQFFEIKKMFSTPISGLKINFFNPEKSNEIRPNDLSQNRGACGCDQPVIIPRTEWCPDGSCLPHPNPSFTDVTHLIVHHTVTSNTSNDWAAVVRSIWDFHVNINGWSDIGYNFLVDPEGNIYDGRGNDVQGAHFCGTNSGTMGTAMIGDYTAVPPTDEAFNSLKELLAWKNCDRDLEPLGAAFHASSGKTLNHISGHRDGCSTACPGDAFYPLFSDLRESVHSYIEDNCSDTGSENPFLNDETVQVFPNPTDGNLNIGIENLLFGDLKIRVFDNQLRKVLKDFDYTKTTNNQLFNMELTKIDSNFSCKICTLF